MKRKALIAAGFLLLALIVLPTGDPTDFFITLPLIAWLGSAYWLLAAIVFLLYAKFVKKWW